MLLYDMYLIGFRLQLDLHRILGKFIFRSLLHYSNRPSFDFSLTSLTSDIHCLGSGYDSFLSTAQSRVCYRIIFFWCQCYLAHIPPNPVITVDI